MDDRPAFTIAPRAWHPLVFRDGQDRVFRVSFRIGEEATWDHRFHDLDGREIDQSMLQLSVMDQQLIQARCDGSVGSH